MKNDLISRQAAIEAVVGCTNCGTENVLRAYVTKHSLENGWTGGIVDALDAIEQLPSIQPDIIRCKDCKYCEHWYADKGRCFLWHEGGIDVFEEGFCNYAERRTDGRFNQQTAGD